MMKPTPMKEINRTLTAEDTRISERIKSLYSLKKSDLGLTQAKIAEFTGWTQGFISHAMTGRVRLNLEHKLIWSRILNVDVHQIDPNFDKNHSTVKAPVLHLNDYKPGTSVENRPYQLTAPIGFGLVPRGSTLNVDPSMPAGANNLVVVKVLDQPDVFIGLITKYQQTQVKVRTSFDETINIKFSDLEYLHVIREIGLV